MENCPDYNIPCPHVAKSDSIFLCDESQGKCEYWRKNYFAPERPPEMSAEELAKHLGIRISKNT